MQPSDEEVLGYNEASSSDEDDAPAKRGKKRPASDSEASEDEEEEEEEEGWGTSKKDYYNADEIQTEADALEEEAEAKRLQQKKLAKMSEADFGFDEDEWKTAEKEDEDGDVVTEVLKDIEITEDMSPEERLRLLQQRYPEFEFLANEFVQLHPLLEDLNDEIAATGSKNTVAVLKQRALGAYMGALTMYFAILSSPAQDGGKLPIDPMELRDHPVMESLLECRQMWSKASKVEAHHLPFDGMDEDEIEEEEQTPESEDEEIMPAKKMSKTARKAAEARAKAKEAKAAAIAAAEDELADIDTLIPSRRARVMKAAAKAAKAEDSDSDFGEEESLSTRAAAEKAAKKKSLRFYTSQIAQKANRRADAGRDAGGDADLPYRERLRDRQARLNAEAERRGKKLDEYGRGTALGGDSDEEEENGKAREVREEEDEYYDMVAQTSKSKKAARAVAAEEAKAAAEAAKLDRVEGEGDLGDGDKRAIGYVIQKNKGLAPKRKKEVRNPRVKKRMKYEEKKKKLSSMRAVYKGGEERGGYSGEKTGIKPGLVKSIKL